MFLSGCTVTGKVVSSGVWIPIQDFQFLDGNAFFSNTVNSTLNYEFNGSYIKIITQKRNDFGIMNVYIDNELTKHDLYSVDIEYQVPIEFTLDNGSHNVVIEVSDEKNPGSGGNYVVVDDVIFIQAKQILSTTIIEETDNVSLNVELYSKLTKAQGKLKQLNKSEKVLIKVKPTTKSRIRGLLKKSENSLDKDLLFAEIDKQELGDLELDDAVIEIWPDLETQSLVFSNSGTLNPDTLWTLGYLGSGVKVAILDTGLAEHELYNIVESVDFTGTNTNDVFGHGTHVAGIASVMANESLIYNVKVLNDNGAGQLSWLINGIDWAIINDIDVISLSLGATYSGSALNQLNSPEILKIEEAIANGITVVVASGNCAGGLCGSFDCVTTPGIARDAITVGAVDSSNSLAHFSSGCLIGDYIKPDLVAPGVNIYSSVPSGYDYKSGTSMATPFVTGSVALMLSSEAYTPLEIKSMFESNAVDLGEIGKDVKYGSGLLNLEGIFDVLISSSARDENYVLNIPLFEINQKDKLYLEYFNIEKGNPRIITVFYDLEELENHVSDVITRTIPSGKSTKFALTFTPNIPGKHLLKVKISEGYTLLEEFSVPINVASGIVDDKFEGVSVRQ